MNQTNENHEPNADAKLLLGDVILSAIEKITGVEKENIKRENLLIMNSIDELDMLEIIMVTEKETGKQISDYFYELSIYTTTVNKFIEWVHNNSA